jgi:hypothetical protein
MIKLLIKIIVSTFLSAVSIVLFSLWLLFGTIVLLALIIRLISLYTIALLNSFISSTPLCYNYTKAIEDVIDMYINTFIKILNIPILPWRPITENDNNTFRALLNTEIYELKKSWAITLIVFVSYVLSFGFSLAWIISEKEEKISEKYETELLETRSNLEKYITLSNTTETKVIDMKLQIIKSLYCERKWNTRSISKVLDISPDEVDQLIEKYDIK